MEIDFMTSNELKASIAAEILDKSGIKVNRIDAEVIEPQEIDSAETIRQKMQQAVNTVRDGRRNRFLMISDDGFYIDSLNRFPGALLKPVMACLTPEQLLKLASPGERATYVNSAGVYDFDRKEMKTFTCETNGTLSEPKGSNPRGLLIEGIFVPDGHSKTLKEMDDKEWDSFFASLKSRLPYWSVASYVKSDERI